MILLEIIYKIMKGFCELLLSLPAWERGLKSGGTLLVESDFTVAPCVGAWIEIMLESGATTTIASLPAWERGLK